MGGGGEVDREVDCKLVRHRSGPGAREAHRRGGRWYCRCEAQAGYRADVQPASAARDHADLLNPKPTPTPTPTPNL